jgi:hypothetical protein
MVGRPNYTLNLSRPGFGPGLKPLVRSQASRRHAGCSLLLAASAAVAAAVVPRDFGTWALAAQVSV